MAFWCMTIAWVMQFIIFKETTRPILPFMPGMVEEHARRLLIMFLIARIWLLAGVIFIAKILINKEPKGNSFNMAAIGLSILILLELASFIL